MCPRSPEKGVGSPGARETGSCGLSYVDAANRTQPMEAASALTAASSLQSFLVYLHYCSSYTPSIKIWKTVSSFLSRKKRRPSSRPFYFLGSSAKIGEGHRACQKHMMLNMNFHKLRKSHGPWNGSAGKGACHQAWWPMFELWDLHVKERTDSISCLLAYTCSLWPVCLWVYTQSKWIIMIKYFQCVIWGWKMVQWLNVITVLAEDLGLSPSSHILAPNH